MNVRVGKYVWIIMLAVLLAAVYIMASTMRAPGKLAAPVDDAYIHYQYARQITNGSPWQYNSGDAFSSGATSMLYPFILAAGMLAGVTDRNLVWYAILLGDVALILSAVLVLLITRQLLVLSGSHSEFVSRYAPVVAAMLFLLSGAIQWGYFNGMETGLFTLLLLASFQAYLAKRFVLASATIFFASLTRPEGLFMAAIFWIIVAIDWWRSDDREARTHILLASTAAVALSLIPVILNYVLTGAVMATGAQAKSWFQNVPFRPGDILTSVGRDFLRILQRLSLGFLANPPWPLIPLLLPASLLGWIVLWFRKRYSVVGLTLGWFVAGAGSMATLITAIWQRGRYQVPMVAFLLPIAVVAGAFLLERLPESRRKITGAISVTLLVTLSIWQTGVSINSYAHSVYSTAKQQIAIAEWIDANLPQGARVAVHDAGAIRFIGNRDTFDMIGLTSQGVATAWRHGMGAVFEHMENAEDRPGYFATYPDVFSIPYLQETDLFSNELYRVSLPDFSRHSSAGPTQVVYDANWRLANSGEAMIQEDLIRATARMELVDSIDVADLEDERRHNFTWSEGPVIPGFPTEVRQFQYRTAPEHTVLDGGRLLTGAMAFEVSVEPGTDLMIIGRFHAQNPVTLDVRANGKSVGRWRYPTISGEWLESAFQIPADYVTSNPLEIQLALSDASAPGIKFEPYYLWFQQGEYNEVRPVPRQRINTRFAEGLELIGYDLDSRQYRPGETLPLVLYWRSDKRNDVDAVVFVHLYSENGELVAQLDQRPYFGTRPPYTWNADEIVTDPISLELPCHLSDGRYDLVVGLYDRRTLARMEIIKSDLTVLADNRLLLRTLMLDTDCRITGLIARFLGRN